MVYKEKLLLSSNQIKEINALFSGERKIENSGLLFSFSVQYPNGYQGHLMIMKENGIKCYLSILDDSNRCIGQSEMIVDRINGIWPIFLSEDLIFEVEVKNYKKEE